jgi:hypothetical protein
MRKYIFPILIAISALALAGAAAFFSVTGLSKLFGGAKTEVIIMASALEFAKLVVASFLHRYWKDLKLAMKTYLTIGVIIVMIITSLGIYGFLSSAYSTTSGKLQNIDSQIQMVDQNKTIITSEIHRLEESKSLKSDRVKSLVNLRSNQETRLDSLYNRKQISVAKRVESQIDQANKDITVANVEIDTLNNQIQRKYGEVTALDMEVLDLKNNDTNSEVGPLKYIAKLTGRDMDSVVNFFILLLIFVFDPLAVMLVVATNFSIEKEFGEGRNKDKKEPEPKVEPENIIEEAVVEEPIEEIKVDEPVVEEHVEDIIPIDEIISDEKPAEDLVSIDEISPEEENPVLDLKNEVVSYIADEKGEFKPEPIEEKPMEEKIENHSPQELEAINVILEQIKAQDIGHNASYLNFLEVLFQKGKASVGDILPSYPVFLEEMNLSGYKYTEKELTDFLLICNLFKITDMSQGKERRIAKDYQISKSIISLLSK